MKFRFCLALLFSLFLCRLVKADSRQNNISPVSFGYSGTVIKVEISNDRKDTDCVDFLYGGNKMLLKQVWCKRGSFSMGDHVTLERVQDKKNQVEFTWYFLGLHGKRIENWNVNKYTYTVGDREYETFPVYFTPTYTYSTPTYEPPTYTHPDGHTEKAKLGEDYAPWPPVGRKKK